MPERTSYAQGTPNWVDLQTDDQEGAKAFYGDLFGWEYDEQPMGEGPVYAIATRAEGRVAAIAPQPATLGEMGAPPAWNTYIAVDDVDAAAERVKEAGGQVMMEPFDVVEAGRMAAAVDPTGAMFLLWQAKELIGATVVNEPATWIWNELLSNDLEKALAFYEQVLGIGHDATEMGGQQYTMLKVGDDVVGGATTPQDGAPSSWHVWFAVEDVPATTAKAAELGGEVLEEHTGDESPIGHTAALRDPQGAVFSVIAPRPRQEAAE